MSAAIYLTPRMLILGWLGVISGLPLALTASTLTAWLADSAVDIKTIGLFALVGIPYTFKFAWAPLMDGLSPPLAKAIGRRRAWMVWWLLALGLSTLIISLLDPTQDLTLVALLTLALAFSSASFDINVDALRIDWLPDLEQGAGAAMAVTGYRIGMVISSAGALYLAEFYSWQIAYQIIAVVLLLGLVPTLLAQNPPPACGGAGGGARNGTDSNDVTSLSYKGGSAETNTSSRQYSPPLAPPQAGGGFTTWLLTYVVDPFRQFASQPKWWLILVFIILFKLGDAVLGQMTMPFLIREAGYAKDDIALVVKIYGTVASIVAGFIGGWAVLRFGILVCLVLGGIMQSVANLPYAYLAMLPAPDNAALAITIAVDNAFGAFATIAFVAYISSLCNKRFSATQYALLNSLASVGRIFFSATSGALAAAMGWPVFFVFTAVLGLPALFILWLLRRYVGGERRIS